MSLKIVSETLCVGLITAAVSALSCCIKAIINRIRRGSRLLILRHCQRVLDVVRSGAVLHQE